MVYDLIITTSGSYGDGCEAITTVTGHWYPQHKANKKLYLL
jgi:hypothetical protein